MQAKLSFINETRAAAGLPPLTAVKTAKKNAKAQNANRAAHAQKCRDLKNLRSSSKKGK